MKTKLDIQRPEIPSLGQAKKMWQCKVLRCDHNPPPLKSGHCGQNITQLSTPKNQFKKVFYIGNKETEY